MKKLLITAALVLFAALAYAGKADMPRDGKGIVLQGFAPNGTKEFSIAGKASTVKDMTDDLEWAVYCADASIFRTMASSTKSGVAHTIPATTWVSRKVNPATPFINISGCTGTVQRQ